MRGCTVIQQNYYTVADVLLFESEDSAPAFSVYLGLQSACLSQVPRDRGHSEETIKLAAFTVEDAEWRVELNNRDQQPLLRR